jgi:hypothetical protein
MGCDHMNFLVIVLLGVPLTTKESHLLNIIELLANVFMSAMPSKNHSLLIILTSREPVPMAQGLLRSPTPSAWIQGLPGGPAPEPLLPPNIDVGCAKSQH